MASDRLLQVSGPIDLTAPWDVNHVQAAAISANGDLVATNPAKRIGPYRSGEAHYRVAGALTGGGSLAIEIYECDNAAGANPTLIATSPTIARSHDGNDATAVDPPGDPTEVAARDNVAPTVFTFSTGSRGWVKATAKITGTVSASGVSCVIVPVGTSSRRSGS